MIHHFPVNCVDENQSTGRSMNHYSHFIGDLEADTVAGKTGRACLLTLSDWKTSYEIYHSVELHLT